MADQESAVIAARAQMEQVQQDAKALGEEAKAAFGKAIATERERPPHGAGKPQETIAAELGLTREQVRRYERHYEAWVKEHGREPGPWESLRRH